MNVMELLLNDAVKHLAIALVKAWGSSYVLSDELIEKIRAFDIVEVSPPLDYSGITIKAMMGILTEILAKISNQ